MTPDPFWRALGARVREYRGAAGLSQVQLAARAGASRQAVGSIEAGAQRVDALRLALIARALGETVESLTRGLPLPPVPGEPW